MCSSWIKFVKCHVLTNHIDVQCSYLLHKVIILTGVFKPLETVSDVRKFVCNSLEREEFPFSLSAFSNVLSDDSISIAQAGLVSIA